MTATDADRDAADPDGPEGLEESPGPEQPDGPDEPEGPVGPLDNAAARRAAAADVAIVATSDAHGERDVTVLSGPTCFVRVLDAHRLAYPDEGVEPASASRANLAEEPGIAMLLVESGAGGDERRGLHLNGSARVVAAEELRGEHPDLPVDPVPWRATDVWVVVEVGDAYLLDGDEVPPLGPARAPAASAVRSPAGRPGLVTALAAAVIVLVLALVGSVAVLVGRAPSAAAPPSPPPPTPVADAGPTGPPTLFGRVRDVPGPARIVVDVAGRPIPVDVLGVDPAVPACAIADATAFARRTLQGQDVTLVPDPTIPPTPGVTRAYAVLGSQLSYTDAVIRAGWARAAGPSRYRAVYDREQSEAERAGVGMYGPPCRP